MRDTAWDGKTIHCKVQKHLMPLIQVGMKIEKEKKNSGLQIDLGQPRYIFMPYNYVLIGHKERSSQPERAFAPLWIFAPSRSAFCLLHSPRKKKNKKQNKTKQNKILAPPVLTSKRLSLQFSFLCGFL